jgi:hypothetical protein
MYKKLCMNLFVVAVVGLATQSASAGCCGNRRPQVHSQARVHHRMHAHKAAHVRMGFRGCFGGACQRPAGHVRVAAHLPMRRHSHHGAPRRVMAAQPQVQRAKVVHHVHHRPHHARRPHMNVGMSFGAGPVRFGMNFRSPLGRRRGHGVAGKGRHAQQRQQPARRCNGGCSR